MKNTFTIKARLASFKNAWKGVTVYVRQEHNAWIHCTITVLVIITGLLFHISTAEWIAVIFAIGFVLAAEAINSAIERLSDVVQPEKDVRIRDVKDICAGAVLISAITAAITGNYYLPSKTVQAFLTYIPVYRSLWVFCQEEKSDQMRPKKQ